MKTTLKKESCFNPFIMDGKVVESINFYENGKVVATTKWFSNGNNDFNQIVFPFETKKALRVNLNRTDAYYVFSKSSDRYEKRYDLYIHAGLVNIKYLGKETVSDTWYAVTTADKFEISLYGERFKYIKEYGEVRIGIVLGDHKETFYCNHVSEKPQEYINCEAKAEKVNAVIGRRMFSAYDMHEFLTHFDIIEK